MIKIIAFFVVSLLLFSGSLNPAEGVSPLKATGSVEFIFCTTHCRDAAFTFSVHAANGKQPDRGMAFYEATLTSGVYRWLQADIDCVYIDPDTHLAIFSGKIIDTNWPAWEEDFPWLYAAVEDGGTPGSNGDICWVFPQAEDPCSRVKEGRIPPRESAAVHTGNLTVHPHQSGEAMVTPLNAPETVTTSSWSRIKSMYQ